ncbi:hypothetical protein JTE90_013336 [Oedothorax gibbosus]|uniref:Secreted protein n=1 Tax=Oedothorax gibbosus TaxID=931172 RepID=A0AAV6VEK2_9ARAC|nr:hypothetical protein JTE90_013336 [Oedothorax gibbosus]
MARCWIGFCSLQVRNLVANCWLCACWSQAWDSARRRQPHSDMNYGHSEDCGVVVITIVSTDNSNMCVFLEEFEMGNSMGK